MAWPRIGNKPLPEPMDQVMVCFLFTAEPLHEAMLTYCQLDPQEQTCVKFEQFEKKIFQWNVFENVINFVQNSMC